MYHNFVNYLILSFCTCVLLNSLSRCHWFSSCHFRCWGHMWARSSEMCLFVTCSMCFNLITFWHLFYMFSCIIDAIIRLPLFFCKLNALKLTLWGDFAEVEGDYLSRNLFYENVLLASRMLVRGYEGTYIIYRFE